MSQPLRMHQIRRILELQTTGQSLRHTERLTGLSRNTVREYLRRVAITGLSAQQALDLDDDSLAALVYTEDIELLRTGRTKDERYAVFEKRVDYFSSELGKRGVTRQLSLGRESERKSGRLFVFSVLRAPVQIHRT